MLRLAVLVSGAGSNLRAIAKAIDRGDLEATIELVVSNRSQCGAMVFAIEQGIPTRHVSSRTHENPATALREVLIGLEGVILAGYARQVPTIVVDAFPNRILNLHPAPLPRFGGHGMWGMRVHEAVLESGVPSSGPTVHLVDAEYDTGQVLAHHPVPVIDGDTPETLKARVQVAEHDLYWRVIQKHFRNLVTSF